ARTLEGGRPESAGSRLEAVGNGSPRGMTASRRAVRPAGDRTRRTARLVCPSCRPLPLLGARGFRWVPSGGGAGALDPAREPLGVAHPVVEDGAVDVEAPHGRAVLGAIRPGPLDLKDRRAAVVRQPGEQAGEVGGGGLAFGLVEEPDVEGPQRPRRGTALHAEVQAVGVDVRFLVPRTAVVPEGHGAYAGVGGEPAA